jgi:hypothetical protein
MSDRTHRPLSRREAAAPGPSVDTAPAGPGMAAQREAMSAPEEESSFLGRAVDWVADKGRGAYEAATDWHFEGRDARNGEIPPKEVLDDPSSGWKLLPPSLSTYHQNGEGADELKYIHPDGREAVLDGDTLEPVTDPRWKGTYNYISLMPPDERETIGDHAEYWARRVGHIAADVVPYYIGGNARGEH